MPTAHNETQGGLASKPATGLEKTGEERRWNIDGSSTWKLWRGLQQHKVMKGEGRRGKGRWAAWRGTE